MEVDIIKIKLILHLVNQNNFHINLKDLTALFQFFKIFEIIQQSVQRTENMATFVIFGFKKDFCRVRLNRPRSGQSILKLNSRTRFLTLRLQKPIKILK